MTLLVMGSPDRLSGSGDRGRIIMSSLLLVSGCIVVWLSFSLRQIWRFSASEEHSEVGGVGAAGTCTTYTMGGW